MENKIFDNGYNIEKHNKNIAVANHTLETDKELSKEYSILNMADFHGLCDCPYNLLLSIREYLMSRKGKVDLVAITGDIDSGLSLSKKDSLVIIKSILDDFSKVLGNVPIYVVPGNHELGIAVKYGQDKIFDLFKSLRTDNIIPLINEKDSYEDLDIYGFAFGSQYYKQLDVDGNNAALLNEYLNNSNIAFNPNKFNVGLVHDCWAVYFSKYILDSKIKNFDLLLSGHSHGGYVPIENLINTSFNDSNYGYGIVEYFLGNGSFLRIPGCSGIHEIGDSTSLSITDGIRRFNGYLPKNIYTTPFVTEINISKRLTKK